MDCIVQRAWPVPTMQTRGAVRGLLLGPVHAFEEQFGKGVCAHQAVWKIWRHGNLRTHSPVARRGGRLSVLIRLPGVHAIAPSLLHNIWCHPGRYGYNSGARYNTHKPLAHRHPLTHKPLTRIFTHAQARPLTHRLLTRRASHAQSLAHAQRPRTHLWRMPPNRCSRCMSSREPPRRPCTLQLPPRRCLVRSYHLMRRPCGPRWAVATAMASVPPRRSVRPPTAPPPSRTGPPPIASAMPPCVAWDGCGEWRCARNRMASKRCDYWMHYHP